MSTGSESTTVSAHWRISKWFPSLSKETIDRLFIFNQELINSNKALNLVSSKSIPYADLVHFADSLYSADVVIKNMNKNEVLYDIAGGSGFPGLVIGIAHPEIKVCIIEHDKKKCEFYRTVVAKTGSKNITVSNMAFDNLQEGSIEQGICRNSSSLAKNFLYLRKSVAAGGQIFFLKPSGWPVEISQIPTQLCSVWSPSMIHEYTLPGTDSNFYVVLAKKLI